MTESEPEMQEKAWQSYEQVAAYVLKQLRERLGLSDIEGKQTVLGEKTGTEWEIDAKGIRESDNTFLIIECRRHTKSRLSQEQVAAIAYRISDIGAAGGITVSPLPLQQGAELVAKAEKIKHVQLDPDSTYERWKAQIEETIHFGLIEKVSISFTESVSFVLRDAAGNIIDQRSG